MSLEVTEPKTETTETPVPATETPEEETVEETTEETVEEEEEETVSDDLSDEDKVNATALYRALKNPETSQTIIAQLAKQAGLLGQTKQEATRTIVDLVKESLGEEYAFLAPKITPAIKAVVQEELKTVQNQLEQEKLRQAEKEVDDAIAEMNRITKGDAKKYENKIASLLDEMPPSGKVPIKKHLMRLYTIAKQDDARAAAKTERIKKASDNAADLGSRLSVAGLSGKTVESKGRISIDEAVERAMNKLERK